jgi:hypothetical protein
MFLVGLFSIIGGPGPANAHTPGANVARSLDGVTAPRANVALGAVERHASPAAFISSRFDPSDAPDSNGFERCFSGCCCGMMCSAALPDLSPTSSLVRLLHGRLVAARELAPESAPAHDMLRPPKA